MGLDGYNSGSNPAAPAGWYPVDGGMQRYWDGAQWTEHIAPAATPPAAPSPPPSSAPPSNIPGGDASPYNIPGGDASPYNIPGGDAPPYNAPGGDAPTPWVGGSPAGQSSPGMYTPGQPGQPGQPTQYEFPGVDDSPPFASSQFGAMPDSGWAAPPPGSFAQPNSAGAGFGPPMAHATIPTTGDDRSMALLIHLLALLTGFLGPLLIWLIKKDQSPFVDHHGKEALNFQFTLFVYWFGVIFLLFFVVGFLLIPVVIVLQILFPILAAVGANRGDYYRYPMTLRFMS